MTPDPSWEEDFESLYENPEDDVDSENYKAVNPYELPDDVDLIDSDSQAQLPFDPRSIETPIPQTLLPLPPAPKPSAPLKAERPADMKPGQKFLNFNKIFQSLQVKTESKKPYKVIASHRKRALLVGWTMEDLLSAEKRLGIYTKVPRICPGLGKQDAQGNQTTPMCPCVARYQMDPRVWEGVLCPNEQMRVFELFIDYVRGLEIEPDEPVDLRQVGDLIRIEIQMERCDQVLQEANNGMVTQAITHVSRSDTPFKNDVLNVVFNAQKSLRSDRDTLYNQLVATRAKRAKSELDKLKAAGGIAGALAVGDLASALADARQPGLQNEQFQLNRLAQERKAAGSIDSEYTVLEDLYDNENEK